MAEVFNVSLAYREQPVEAKGGVMDYTKDIEVLEEFNKQEECYCPQATDEDYRKENGCDKDCPIDEALTHAIEAMEALQSAKTELPEKQVQQGDGDESMSGVHSFRWVSGFNEAHDIFTPIHAKLKLFIEKMEKEAHIFHKENNQLRKECDKYQEQTEQARACEDEINEELTALKEKITVERIARIMAGKYINWKGYLKHAQRVVKNLKGEK